MLELAGDRAVMSNRSTTIVAALCCSGGGCAPTEQARSSSGARYDQYLREVKFGEPIPTISDALGGITFDGCEAGSGLYPFWTLRGRVGTVGVAIGAVGPPELMDAMNHIDQLKYVGHFIIEDDDWKSIRWVYTDGLVQDSREPRNTKQQRNCETGW